MAWLTPLIVLLAVLAPLVLEAQSSPDEQQIRARRESSNAAIASHDTAGIGAALAPNVIVVTSNSVHREGRDAQRRELCRTVPHAGPTSSTGAPPTRCGCSCRG